MKINKTGDLEQPMFISVLELFKIGIGPSSSHTMGPMTAAADFLNLVSKFLSRSKHKSGLRIQCILKGSLAFTGKGHASDKAVVLGLNGYSPKSLIEEDTSLLIKTLWNNKLIKLNGTEEIEFSPEADIIFDNNDPLPEHPNGMIFNLIDNSGNILLSQIYFSIGGGFINTQAEIQNLKAPIKMIPNSSRPYAFSSAESMLQMSAESGLSIAEMKRLNELVNKIFSDDRFASLFFGEITNDKKGLFLYANAGHNPPILFEKKTGELKYLEPTGPLIGPVPNSRYSTDSIYFNPGDLLVIYSDGITEAANNVFEFYKEKRLEKVIRENITLSPKEIAHAILDDVIKFSTSQSKYQDDKTVVVIKRKAENVGN